MRASILLALQLVVYIPCSSQFVSSEDYVLAQQASEKTALVCEDFEPLEAAEKERLKSHLMASSANNVIRELLRDSEGESPLDLFIAKVQEPAFFARLAGPIVACLVLMVIYFSCCCWTGCCSCCRCCKRDRQCNGYCKLLMFLLLVGIGVGLSVAAFLALAGLGAAADGVDRTACASAQMLNTTLAGRTEYPKFLGLLPVLEIFQTLSDSLVEDSKFIKDVKGIVDSTEEISVAISILSQSMALLNDIVRNPANLEPKTSDGTSLKHSCGLCGSLSSALQPAVEALGGSVAEALRAARAEVDKQLSGNVLEELRGSMITFSQPVSDFKATLHSFLGPFIEEELLEQVKEQMNTGGRAGATSFAVLALLLNFSGILSVLCWCTSSTGNSKACVHRCACCTWCCGCWYLFLAFFVGGLLNLVAVPLSSFCLILDDLNGELLIDISAMAQQNFSGPAGDMTIALVENCVNPLTPRNPGIMDIITTQSSNGTTVTMNEKIVGDVTSQISNQFNQIQQTSSSGGDTSLNSSSELRQLIQTIADLPLDSTMLPVDAATDYPSMAIAFAPFLTTSSACADSTLEGNKFYGIGSFVTNMSNYCCSSGGVVSDASCAKNVQCSFESGKATACQEGNRFMDVKQQLRSLPIFKCKSFKVDGNRCDLTNMAEASAGVYVNDCLVNNALETMDYDCSLEELTTLISSFSTQLEKAIERVDRVTNVVMNKIAVDLKALVEENLLAPISRVVEGITCGFMSTMYQDFVDGMCFKGVWGFTAIAASYLACAVLTVFLVVFVYLLWRFSLDSYEEDRRQQQDPVRLVLDRE